MRPSEEPFSRSHWGPHASPKWMTHQRTQLCNGIRAILPLGWYSPGGPPSLDGSAMSEAERLSGLIGEIYDAALDPTLWPEVLAQSARFVDGFSAALVFKD